MDRNTDLHAEDGTSEAGGAAELASKTTTDKADKLIRLSEREQAEGRTGGQAGQRIVYDDAAIERLLDRWVTWSCQLVMAQLHCITIQCSLCGSASGLSAAAACHLQPCVATPFGAAQLHATQRLLRQVHTMHLQRYSS